MFHFGTCGENVPFDVISIDNGNQVVNTNTISGSPLLIFFFYRKFHLFYLFFRPPLQNYGVAVVEMPFWTRIIL